jgi:hypothetical protein
MKGNTGALWYECIVHLFIDNFKAELIYPWWFIILRFQFNHCRTKIIPIPSTQTWHPAPPQSEPGKSMAIDNGTNRPNRHCDLTKRKRYLGSRPCYLLSPASFILTQGNF